RSGIGRAFAAMDFRFRRSARCFRTGTRAYPSAVCEERTTKSELKRQAARWVAPQLASVFVAPQSQPHFGGCSFVAPRQKPTAAQQMPTQFANGTLARQLCSVEPVAQVAQIPELSHRLDATTKRGSVVGT